MSYDAIVIGAGINGLVAAHLLARGGRRTLVVEQRAEADVLPETGWLPPAVSSALGLAGRGLTVDQPDPWIAVPLDGGGRLELYRDVARSAEAIRKVSPKDAAKWPEFCVRMHRLAGVLATLYEQPAPDVETRELGELLRMGKLGLGVRRLGRQGVIDLLRILPMSAADLLDEWFAHDALKGALGGASVLHLRQGPRSGGTSFNLLHHHVGAPAGVFRQGTTNVRHVLAALPGVELRRGAHVRQIVVKGGAVCGVELSDGETIEATHVVSDIDPRATIGLLDAGWLDPEFVRAVRNIKMRGIAARVTLSLDKPAPAGTLAIAPTLTYLERAYDEAKYGRVSAQPYLEARAVESSLVVHVQYAPYRLAGGDWDDGKRRALGEQVAGMLERHVPGLRSGLTGVQVLTPRELEEKWGLTEGQAYHGELTLDQILFMRPVAGWSRYRMPVSGLYLCGSGTHPGGGILGGAGRLAAAEILEDD